MIKNLVFSLFPILLSLITGYGVGRVVSESIRDILVGYIKFLVWFLLVSIGFKFGDILFDKELGGRIILESFIYSTIVTFITFFLLFKRRVKVLNTNENSVHDILKPVFECLIAILMVLIGVFLNIIISDSGSSSFISDFLLYILIFLIGVDLSVIKIQSLSINHFKVPLLSICALFIAAYLSTFVLNKSFLELVILGSGFGWFSLSGPLVGKTLGVEQGAFALLTDLIREFYAIGLLYLVGKNYSNSVIGVCGATAMDSTLPFIKNNCSQLDVQIAIFSGFVLTIIAPFFIILFSFIA